jgi:L-malate glycosyltransferase
MRVLLLAEPASIHTIRWANSLSEKGIEIGVFGFGSYRTIDYHAEVKVFSEGREHQGLVNKLTYLLSIFHLKKIISQFNPDIIHAHYASSYGLMGRMSGFKPFFISVWGSDIYEFPNLSFVHKYILKANLRSANRIFSTSHVMAKETSKLIENKDRIIEVIPFGIDLNKFVKNNLSKGREVVIGTIKTLTFNYGIDVLIEAFNILSSKYPSNNFLLLLGGEGSDKKYFLELVRRLKIVDKVKFLGRIEHDCVPDVLNDFDIFVALSNNESFGVSIIEASACKLPVIVSNVGGLPEVVENRVTGIIVNKKNAVEAAEAMEELVFNSQMRNEMGEQGRERVEKYYNWEVNVQSMVNAYYNLFA